VFEIKTTDAFDAWLDGLRDSAARVRIAARLRKTSVGLLGDVGSVGAGVWEMREHFGPGYRLYYVKQRRLLIVMLAGGDKSTQRADIRRAQQMATELLKE